jgi:predicted 3-demethylubiquinone-9 3-methyltransferase (glyoxalase superfamily)
MQKITPCLWFDGKAEEALTFYASLFEGAEVVDIRRYGEGGPAPKGTVLSATFRLQGQEIMALNGGPMYTFTPAISLFVKCESQAEVDRYWDALVEGGKPMRCGWVTDRFGLSWQIVPTALGTLLQDPDPAKAGRVMQAMMKLVKLDVPTLERAHRGE